MLASRKVVYPLAMSGSIILAGTDKASFDPQTAKAGNLSNQASRK